MKFVWQEGISDKLCVVEKIDRNGNLKRRLRSVSLKIGPFATYF